MPVPSFRGHDQESQMLTTAALLTGLLSAPNPPAECPFAMPRVEVRHGIRVAVPPLGPARPADKRDQQQVFSFYVGLFGR
jgi:hypothetical protein